jgi:mycothiol system anti-sigma-R factor
MADCNETLRELETFLDGELSDHSREIIHAHLGGCHECLEAFEFHAELRTVISAKCHADEMPAGLLARIEQCFGPDPESKAASDVASHRRA